MPSCFGSHIPPGSRVPLQRRAVPGARRVRPGSIRVWHGASAAAFASAPRLWVWHSTMYRETYVLTVLAYESKSDHARKIPAKHLILRHVRPRSLFVYYYFFDSQTYEIRGVRGSCGRQKTAFQDITQRGIATKGIALLQCALTTSTRGVLLPNYFESFLLLVHR